MPRKSTESKLLAGTLRPHRERAYAAKDRAENPDILSRKGHTYYRVSDEGLAIVIRDGFDLKQFYASVADDSEQALLAYALSIVIDFVEKRKP